MRLLYVAPRRLEPKGLEGLTQFAQTWPAELVVGLYAIYGLGLRVLNDPGWTRLWDTRAVTGATIVIFFCAAWLGKVWMSPIGFLGLGVAFANYFLYRAHQVPDVVPGSRSARANSRRSVWGAA